MEIIRNNDQLKKWTLITQAVNITGLAVLGIGMYISFQGNPSLIGLQWLALLIGILLWQVGINLGYQYTRRPRPDEVLDKSLKAAVSDSTLYHYTLPARHVLLTRSGPILFLPIINDGVIHVSGENGDKWRSKKSFFRRFISQQPRLGNPMQAAEKEIANLVAHIRDHAPELEEVPIGAVIVATNPAAIVEIDISPMIPIVKAAALKKIVRKQTGRALPKADYDRLKEIFDHVEQ